jgi:anaerobic selenocysteine-containing dehydrogenase
LRPGSDGAFAILIAHYLCRAKLIDEEYTNSHIEGWHAFYTYLMDLDINELFRATGTDETVVREVAEELAAYQPAAIWLGFGLQRHTNGGQ